jgi:type II secretory pathway predicted ATPase ExeA
LCLTGHVAVAIQANSRLTAHREATAATRTLPELKRELTELLRQLRQPLLVVIDDIDRLTPDEMKAVFQLVRANADLPTSSTCSCFRENPLSGP